MLTNVLTVLMVKISLHVNQKFLVEHLLKPRLEDFQHAIFLKGLWKGVYIHDGLVSFVEQLLSDLLLHAVSPGAQSRPAFKHIQTSANRLQNRSSG